MANANNSICNFNIKIKHFFHFFSYNKTIIGGLLKGLVIALLGEKIKQLRQQRGMSLTELAEKANVSKSYLSTIERDIQKNPSIQFLEKIAEVFGISILDLIRDTDEETVQPLDQDWLDLIKEAMDAGIDKKTFKEFLDYQKWRHSQK